MSKGQPLPPSPSDRIVAVGLLTERDLGVLGKSFRRAYRLEEEHDFHDLLAAIDRADHNPN